MATTMPRRIRMTDVGALEALRQYQFLQRALVAGLLVGGTCAALSVFVVLKRLAFIGQGISHAAFGGIALGLLLFPSAAASGLTLQGITLVFCLAVALAIGAVARRTVVEEDTAIGVLFAVSMAMGLILLALRDAYTPDLMGYLFGSILSVQRTELFTMAAVTGVVLVCIVALAKEWAYFLFDEPMAEVSGVPTAALHYLLLALLALTIVVSIRVVGIILVSACLVIPGATGLLLARRLRDLALVAQAVSLVSVLAGLWASHRFSIPTGATIVVAQFLCFLAAWCVRGRLNN